MYVRVDLHFVTLGLLLGMSPGLATASIPIPPELPEK